MHGTYKIKVRVWPFSSFDGRGREADYKKVGGEHHKFEVRASSFEDAYEKARMIIIGIKANPHVWQAPIQSIEWSSEV